MRWLCYGAGAIGTYVGGSLALAGEDLVFMERADAVPELRTRGLRLDLHADSRRKSGALQVVLPQQVGWCATIEEALRFGPFDASLYALKSFDTSAALNQMRRFAGRLPPLVCFSNGVENEAALAEVLGPGMVLAATVTTAVGRRALGDIVLERLRGVGISSMHALSPKILRAADSALLNGRGYSNAAGMKWSKMLTNLMANATSAILDMPAGEILNHPRLYRLEIGMLRECLAVMRASSIPVLDLPGTPVRALALAVTFPTWASKPLISRIAGSGRGAKMPSFHIDLHSGRGKSEVDFLNGAVVRAGRRLGIATPINEFLNETLQRLTNGDLPLGTYARSPERLWGASGAR